MAHREPKLTPPTTVRLTPALHEWTQDTADQRNDRRGRSGVINDALEHYRAHLEARSERIRSAIGGDGGS